MATSSAWSALTTSFASCTPGFRWAILHSSSDEVPELPAKPNRSEQCDQNFVAGEVSSPVSPRSFNKFLTLGALATAAGEIPVAIGGCSKSYPEIVIAH